MKNAVVLGKGMVGKATMYALGIKDYVARYSGTVEAGELSDFKYIFICLPTPTTNGKCNTELIDEYIRSVHRMKKDNVFIIRSTVIPGTCSRLSEKYGAKIVHVPEFLTEATWKEDSEFPDITVIGADDNDLRDEVAGIFKARYKTGGGR